MMHELSVYESNLLHRSVKNANVRDKGEGCCEKPEKADDRSQI